MTTTQYLRCITIGLVASVMSVTGTIASAEVYKWVDKDGKVHYSDQPTTADAKKLKAKTRDAATVSKPAGNANNSAGASKAPATIADQEMEFRKRRMEKEEAEKKAQVAEQDAKHKQAYCNDLRGELKSYEDGVRFVRYNDKGEKIFLDDAERAKSKARAQASFNKECK